MHRAWGWIAAIVFTLVSSPALAGITPVSAADEAYGKGDHATANRLWSEACEAGNPSGCYELAIVYRDGEGVTSDKARMNALYTRACDGSGSGTGDGRGCFNLAMDLDPYPEEGKRRRNPGKDKLEQSNVFYRRGCDNAYAPACFNLGENTVEGRGLAADMEAGITLMQQACDFQDKIAAKACTSLAFKFDEHEEAPLRADPARSTALFERGCALTDADACTNAGYHYRGGYGVPQNWKRARAYYATACDDADGYVCMHLAPNEYFGGGSAYTKGNVQPGKHRAAGLYQDACDDGLAHGCAALAYLVMRQGKAAASEEQIRSLLAKALELEPRHWLAGFLLEQVNTGELPNFDTRAKQRLGL